MTHISPKIIVAAAAAMLFTSGVALANPQSEHPNGSSSSAVKPNKFTTAASASGQGIASERGESATRSKGRAIRIQLGRGQYIPVQSNNR